VRRSMPPMPNVSVIYLLYPNATQYLNLSDQVKASPPSRADGKANYS
jgi:hypothetical protein